MTSTEPTIGASREQTNEERALTRALDCDPHSAECQFRLGLVLSQQARHEEALAAFRHAATLRPDWADAHNSIGAELATLGSLSDAEQAFRHALTMQTPPVEAYCNLSAILSQTGRRDEASIVLRQAIEYCPPSPVVHYTLGCQLTPTRHQREAELELRRALELDPRFDAAAIQLGYLLRLSGRVDEAEEHARRVVERHPKLALAHIELGNTLMAKCTGDLSEALEHFRHATKLAPDSLAAHVNLSYAAHFVCDDGHAVLAECRRHAEQWEKPYLSTAIDYQNGIDPSRKLRIGYVSPDFREHCQVMFMLPLLRHHDHGDVEIYCYASVADPDEFTHQLKEYADVWRNVTSLDDAQLAQQIQSDRIDILVDLTMHMSKGRPLLFARRPAPVQVAWLAYPGTTGSSTIGYRITDPWLDPPADIHASNRYSERSVCLPDTFWCYDPLTQKPYVSQLPASSNGHVTFGCLNNPYKLTDRSFELWARVMKNVPQSRLILLLAEGRSRDIVRTKFSALGINANRLTFIGYQQRDKYLHTYRDIDLVLDVFPYNGHTTSLDALWMGVPVVTIIGNTPASRAGYSLLSNVGLPELAADSEDGFVGIATKLALDLPRLSHMRNELRARMEGSPLMDSARFARSMEAAYRQMWREWCGIQK